MNTTVVQVAEGKLKGSTRTIVGGNEILAFQGIPYAQPPIGDLRFKSPQPVEPWNGIKDCTNDGSPCIHRPVLDVNIVKGCEDCLFLNVFTKSVEPDVLKPVLVFIHGGAFTSGSNETEMYGPDFLLTEDIVLVTINYRLGLLGFLSLDDPALDVPGNAALKDQTLALKWVQKNIERFGGDPNNVTICGESAGSVSVHFHVLSSSSKGLFHKAILQSGAALNPWATTNSKIVHVLKVAGIDVKDEKEALAILKKMSVEQVFDVQEKNAAASSSSEILFGPVIEKPNPTAFITEAPYRLIASGNYNKVPLILGYCDREGLLMVILKMFKPKAHSSIEEKSIEEKLAKSLNLSEDSDAFKELAKNIQKFYLNGNPEGEILIWSLLYIILLFQLYTDLFFVSGILAAAEFHAVTSTLPVYVYQFSIDAGLNLFKKCVKLNLSGACHGDDLGYMFKSKYLPAPERGSAEETYVKRYMKLIANFMRTSNPTPSNSEFGVTWKPVEKGVLNFLDFGDTLKMDNNPEPEKMKMWRELGKSLHANIK